MSRTHWDDGTRGRGYKLCWVDLWLGAHLLPLLCLLLVTIGCRAPWVRPASDEPSFEQLLEIEARQAGATSASRAASPRDYPAQQVRSRVRPAAYGEDGQDPSRNDDGFGDPKQPRQLEEELAGANPTESELLLRTRLALQNQRRPGKSSRHESSQAAPISPDAPTGQVVRASLSDATSDVEEAAFYNLNDLEDDSELDELEPADGVAVEPNAGSSRLARTARNRPSPPEPSVSSASHGSIEASEDILLAGASQKASDGVDLETRATPPVSSVAEMTWEDHVREAIYQLKETTDAATSPSEQIRRVSLSRLLSIVAGDLEGALQPIEGLEPDEQDYFRHQFKALHDSLDPAGTPVASHRWTLALLSQRKALEHLAAVSKLEVSNLAFCTEVVSYGVVTPFPINSFKADQEVLLYCEVDNFISEPVKAGFETQLQGRYEIVDASGRRVADELLKRDAHVSRNRLRDYFIPYRMYMPKTVPAGSYTLKLTMEDLKGAKFGQAEIAFQIVN